MTDGNVAGLLDVKSALLSRYANSGNIDEAIKMYEEIRWLNSWPDAGTFFSFLVSLCSIFSIPW
jgi:pentatricopeptide repeat protein